MEHASSHGIEVKVIPGISSALSVPAMQNIPLTHRGISESFWVVTGTTRAGVLSKDLYLAAQSSATVVILMGMKKLDEIVEVFKKLNKTNTPIAIIQNGSLPDEKIGLGTISIIVEIVWEKGLSSPATIVAGEIVRHVKKNEFSELVREYTNINSL